jgi:hypothetical protein
MGSTAFIVTILVQMRTVLTVAVLAIMVKIAKGDVIITAIFVHH